MTYCNTLSNSNAIEIQLKIKTSQTQKQKCFLHYFFLSSIFFFFFFFFYKFGTVVGSLFSDHHLWSIFLNNNLLILHKYCQMAPPHRIDAPLLSLSLLVSSSSPTATALTDVMSESVPFFFCSDFRKEILVD